MIRLSTGLVNAQAQSLGYAGALNMGRIEVYSGSQALTADAVKGTLLLTLTNNSGALTKETRATGSVTITGVTAGSINTVTVGGLNIIPDGAIAVAGGETTSTMATKLRDAINRNGMMDATVSGAVVTIRGRPGTGVTTAAVTASLTTVTASYVNMGSGVAGVAPVNGLYFAHTETGILVKPTAQVWSGVGVAEGTASWARFYSSDTADTGAALVAAPWYPRMDGNCGVGTGDFRLSVTAIVVNLPVTCDVFRWTQPNS